MGAQLNKEERPEFLPLHRRLLIIRGVTHGRFLERARIEAGYADLFEPDGVLRPTDVGKNIAIPGAADLVTTIAALANRREIKDAVMDADSDILSGILIHPATNPPAIERLGSTHIGRRLTVGGH